eukprot:15211345-Alexandrium_andersonii.AAC.1
MFFALMHESVLQRLIRSLEPFRDPSSAASEPAASERWRAARPSSGELVPALSSPCILAR